MINMRYVFAVTSISIILGCPLSIHAAGKTNNDCSLGVNRLADSAMVKITDIDSEISNLLLYIKLGLKNDELFDHFETRLKKLSIDGNLYKYLNIILKLKPDELAHEVKRFLKIYPIFLSNFIRRIAKHPYSYFLSDSQFKIINSFSFMTAKKYYKFYDFKNIAYEVDPVEEGLSTVFDRLIHALDSDTIPYFENLLSLESREIEQELNKLKVYTTLGIKRIINN